MKEEKEVRFGEHLRKLRENRKISQTKLADELGIKQNSLSSYENGNRFPEMMTLLKIANYFDVSVDDLVYKVEEETDDVIEKHNEIFIDLENGISIEEIALKNKIFVDGNELPLERKKAILEQIEFQYRKWRNED